MVSFIEILFLFCCYWVCLLQPLDVVYESLTWILGHVISKFTLGWNFELLLIFSCSLLEDRNQIFPFVFIIFHHIIYLILSLMWAQVIVICLSFVVIRWVELLSSIRHAALNSVKKILRKRSTIHEFMINSKVLCIYIFNDRIINFWHLFLIFFSFVIICNCFVKTRINSILSALSFLCFILALFFDRRLLIFLIWALSFLCFCIFVFWRTCKIISWCFARIWVFLFKFYSIILKLVSDINSFLKVVLD